MARPRAVVERSWSMRRWRRMVREDSRLSDMVSKPDISISRVCRAWASLFPPRNVPITPDNQPLDAGAWDACRSSCWSRAFFSRIISVVASSPVCFLAISASETSLGFGPKLCQTAETDAKPESRAISATPVMPSLSRHAWKTFCFFCNVSWMLLLSGSHAPMVQKRKRKAA